MSSVLAFSPKTTRFLFWKKKLIQKTFSSKEKERDAPRNQFHLHFDSLKKYIYLKI